MQESKVKIELTFEGFDLNPENVTKKVGLEPYCFHKRGEISQNGRRREQGSWSIQVPYEVSYDVSDQIEKLFQLIENKKKTILELKKLYKGDLILSVVIEVENQIVPGIVFEKKHIALLAELEVEVDVDISLLS